MPDSSSTTRILCMLGRGSGEGGLRNSRQLPDEACADGLILLDANRSMMLLDDPAYDRQSQAGPALSSGKIRKKKFFLQLATHAVPGVCDSDFDRVAAGHQRSRNMYLAHQGILHRFSRVVHQVRHCPLDGL